MDLHGNASTQLGHTALSGLEVTAVLCLKSLSCVIMRVQQCKLCNENSCAERSVGKK